MESCHHCRVNSDVGAGVWGAWFFWTSKNETACVGARNKMGTALFRYGAVVELS